MGDLTVLQRVDQSTGSGSVVEWGPASSGVVRSAPVHTITGTTGLGDTSVLLSQVLGIWHFGMFALFHPFLLFYTHFLPISTLSTLFLG